MVSLPEFHADELPLEAVRRIDQACVRFERVWRSQSAADIGEILDGVHGLERAALLHELIALDVEYRIRAGESPAADDYLSRFDDLDADWLKEVLRDGRHSVPTSSNERSRHVRCPHCQNTISLEEQETDEIVCSGCGSSFRVHDIELTAAAGVCSRLGRFELLSAVGVGAFGEVWRARDTELDRIVALKVPHRNLLGSDEFRERFLREARAAAQLRHPGIVAVLEVVDLDGTPAIVSQFVEGVPLQEMLKLRRLGFRDAAQLLCDVAVALDYAHSAGLVHRDIKPANIMVEQAEEAVEGTASSSRDSGFTTEGSAADARTLRPLLVDFGLALRGDAEIAMTMDGQIIGTPAYMSPEQASGKGHAVDARSDIYSLGVILYELLCGELPFRGSRVMLLQQVLHEDPRPPRQLNDKIPRDLETICLKALAKPPEQRYQTSAALADDLRRWLRGEPIAARPVSVVERSVRWAKRRPAPAALLAVAFFLAFVGFPSAVGLWRRSETALADAEVARQAEAVAAYSLQIRLAQSEQERNNSGRAEELLDASAQKLRDWEYHLLRRARFNRPWTDVGTPGDRPTWVTFSRDEQRMVVLCEHGVRLFAAADQSLLWTYPGPKVPVNVIAGASPEPVVLAFDDESVEAWDTGHDDVLWSIQRTPLPTRADEYYDRLSLSSDGTLLAVAGRDGRVQVLDADSGNVLHVADVSFAPDAIRFRRDGNAVIIASLQRAADWQFDADGPVNTVFQEDAEWIAVSADGARLAVVDRGNGVRVWDPVSGVELLSIPQRLEPVLDVEFSHDGRRAAVGGYNGLAEVWDVDERRLRHRLSGHMGNVSTFAFHPNGKRLATGSNDRTIKLWDIDSGQEVLTLPHPGRSSDQLSFSPGNGWFLAAVDWSVVAQVRDATPISEKPGSDSLKIAAHSASIRKVSFTADGESLFSASEDGTLKLFDWVTRQERLSLTQHHAVIRDMAISSDGTTMVSVSLDGSARVWDVDTGRERFVVPQSESTMSCAASGTGELIAIGLSDGHVLLYDGVTGTKLATLEVEGGTIWCLAFDRDARQLAVGTIGGQMTLFDLRSEEVVSRFGTPNESVFDLEFNSDGTRLASGGFDGRATVWDPLTGEDLCRLGGDEEEIVFSVAWSHDDRLLLSGMKNGTIRVWDTAATGASEPLTELRGHLGIVWTMAFHPEGRWLAAAGGYGTHGEIRIWDTSRWNDLRMTRTPP